MSMRPLNFGNPPAMNDPVGRKLDWCINALKAIQQWTNEGTAMSVAKGFTVADTLTENRTFDPDTVTLPQLADVVGTVLQDLRRGGSKRT